MNKTFKENKDFRTLYYRGKSKVCGTVVVYAMKRKNQSCRYGITTSKKTGNAVKRNRSRRVIRAAYSQLEDKVKGSWDFVFVARAKTSTVKMQAVQRDMEKAFIALGVI